MRRRRLHVDAPLSAGASVSLSEDDARHVLTVLRLEPGETIFVFNAAEGEWRGTLAAQGKRGAMVSIETQARSPQPTQGPALLFAPVKRHATDWIVEKATELGAVRLAPVITRRTQAETVRLDRWRSIAKEAAEQCERLDLPDLDAPVPLARALDQWPSGATLVFADEGGGAALVEVVSAGPHPAGLLVGPEGGFDEDERRMLRAHPAVRAVSLGPMILRAETACVAGLSVLQAWAHRGGRDDDQG